MLLKIFGNTKPTNFILTCLLSALCVIISKIWILEGSFSLWEIVQTAGIVLLMWGNLFLVDLINNSFHSSQKDRFVLFFFFSISNFFPHIYTSLEIIAANFFVLWIILQLMKIKNTTYEKKLLFDTSLLLFLAGMCYSLTFLFVIALWIITFLYTATPVRNFFIPIVVFFGLSFLITSILLPLGHYTYFIAPFGIDIFNIQKYLHPSYWVPLVFLSLIALVCFVISLRKRKKNNNSNHLILTLSTFTLVSILALSNYPKNADILFLILPMSLLFGNQIVKIEKIQIKKAILWIFLLFPLILQMLFLKIKG